MCNDVMQPPVSIVTATADYERWLASKLDVIKADVKAKHQAMAGDPFSFLRATYYRWAQIWPETGKTWASLQLPGVGDLHLENFGTWRDAEGRLVWGVNDFDECGRVSFTSDLARLATSALLACREDHLMLSSTEACAAIWQGYIEGLEAGGGPFVLEEEHLWLRALALGVLRNPATFWNKFDPRNARPTKPPAPVMSKLKAALPKGAAIQRIVHRQSGLGSLGRPRFAVLAEWNGAKIAREAKAILPNGVDWARGASGTQPQNMGRMITHALRGTDPFNHVSGDYILRRLSPHCSRIELGQLPKSRDERALLHAMGWETASTHLSSQKSNKALKTACAKLKRKWLFKAASAMTEATLTDWKAWKKHHKGLSRAR